MADDKHLYIIDGHALAYRAYYATIRTPMTTSRGQPTGALYGFALYLMRLLQEHKCPHIVAIFDSPKPTFRHEMYKDYKANREEMPDDLKAQMQLMFKLVDCFNIKRLAKEGFEADDIMAWLTKKAEKAGYAVSLVTRDKDLMQLVGGKTRLLAPESGGVLEPMGREQVKEKMGVYPEQIRDLLALMGDSSDNIPGVPGVGPKTAIKILEKAGDIDTLLANPACVDNPKLQVKIEENRDNILISKKLATLHLDMDPHLEMDIDSLKFNEFDKGKCIELFKEMEFGSLLRNPLFEEKKEVLDFTVIVPTSLKQIEDFAEKIKKAGFVSVDTETTSTVPREARLVGISMAVSEIEALYIPVGHDEKEKNLGLEGVLKILKPVFESPAISKIGQNLKYDYQILKNYDIKLSGIIFDVMIAAYVIDPGKRQYSLDALAAELLGASTTPIELLIGKKGKDQRLFSSVPVDQAAHYSGEDVVLPIKLRKILSPVLKERNLLPLFDDIEIPLVSVLAELEWQGILVDEKLLAELSKEYTIQLDHISRDIFKLAGQELNLNSPKQISEILFDKMGLPKSKKTKTGLSTDVDALEKLAPDHPIAQKLLEYREVQKLLSTYIDALPLQVSKVTGRLHTSFNQTIAATGRLSSTNPNLQNIPIRTEAGARIRGAFIVPPGTLLVSADYSQIELRILAHLSGDKFLQQAFHEDRDIHTQTASAIYGVFPEMVTPEQRRAAKTINFGLMYGMGPINLSRQLTISFREAQEFIDAYFRQFPSIHEFMEKCKQDVRDKGYAETMLGRRRYLPEVNAEQRQVREAAERTAINTPVQGTAADIIKIAMVNINREIEKDHHDAKMLLQVHDELVFEVAEKKAPEFKEWAIEKMSSAFALSVPLKVEAGIGKNWREAH
jgi:DNA polymerase I